MGRRGHTLISVGLGGPVDILRALRQQGAPRGAAGRLEIAAGSPKDAPARWLLAGAGRRAAREREDRLQVLVGEAELQAEEVVAPVLEEDVIDAAEQPQLVDELVADVNAVA